MNENAKKRTERSLPNSVQKIVDYFFNLQQRDAYMGKIYEIRKKYKIPPHGFIPNKINKGIIYPKNWRYVSDSTTKSKLKRDIKKICDEYGFDYGQWEKAYRSYLFYNILVNSAGTQFELIINYDMNDTERHLSVKNDKLYPVVLRIHTHTTKRDLLDYISKNYKSRILPIQQFHRNSTVMISKLRHAKNHQRDTWIWENRHMPRKEIMKKLSDEFGTPPIDVGLIGKIISLQRKARNGV